MNKASLLKDHFHFIGVGGIGMSAIAMALLKKGYSVSGSDLISNTETIKLKKSGAIIFDSQIANNITYLVSEINNKVINCVISSAIKKENQELRYCLENNFAVKHRSEILGMIMKDYTSLAIAGSHGKTSTSTFLSTLLELCTNNSSTITGGIVPIYNSNSHVEDTKFLVAEIDESDGTISEYKCDIGVISNIDFDHCDHFSCIDEILLSFKQFASNCKRLLINYDCKISRNNFESHTKWSNKITNNVKYSLIPYELKRTHTIAKYYENGIYIDTLKIPIPGLHNLSNITASIATSRMIGVELKTIQNNIKFLKLPKKRFEFRGEVNERFIYDDYAHHPNEIKATIDLARLFIDKNSKDKNEKKSRLVLIFQPHRFSRVKYFFNEFIEELSKADVIYLTDIFGAGESNDKEINSQIMTNNIYKKNKNVKYLKDYNEIKNKFYEITEKGDFIINMGAGDCHNFWENLNKK